MDLAFAILNHDHNGENSKILSSYINGSSSFTEIDIDGTYLELDTPNIDVNMASGDIYLPEYPLDGYKLLMIKTNSGAGTVSVSAVNTDHSLTTEDIASFSLTSQYDFIYLLFIDNVWFDLNDHNDMNNVDDAESGVDHGHITDGTQTIAGDKTFSGDVEISSGILDLTKTGGQNKIQIGQGQTSNQYAYIDFIGDTTYSDYGFRVIRGNTGANTTSTLEHRGEGDFIIKTKEHANIKIYTDDTFRGFWTDTGAYYNYAIRDNTASNSANIYMNSSTGKLYRSTSSIFYKKDIEDIGDQYSEAIYNMRPVWYRSKCEDDPAEYSYWGFIAEEVAQIDPRLVFWGYNIEDYEEIEVEEESPEGIITHKEKVLKQDAEQHPEGVQYERLTVFLVKEAQKHQERINTLEQEVETLKAMVQNLIDNK